MTSDRVKIAFADGIADVRLNRPDKLNAMDRAQFAAVARAIDELAAMPGLRCVVLSGEGRAFCAGVDLTQLADGVGDLMERTHGEANIYQQVAWGWRRLPVPVIAAVHGQAFGAGCQIMLGADLRLLAPDAQVSVMEMRWGLVPDMAGMALLRGLVREDRMREAVFTARRYNAAEAVEIGLATRVAEDPHAEAMGLARAIAGSSPDAIRAAKRLMNLPAATSAADILLGEAREQTDLIAGDNHQEAVRAGLARRAPVYRD